MKFSKFLFVAAILAFFAFTACSPAGGGGGGGAAPAGGDSGGAAAAADVADGDGVHLVYWAMWNPTEPTAIVFERAVRDFESLNPHITVEINWAGRETRQTLPPAIDNNVHIDIFDEGIDRVNDTWARYTLNLEEFYQKVFPTTGGRPFIEIANPALMNLAYYHSGGIYSVNYNPFALVFMYNKDHFDAAGITSEPRTWAEFMDACQRLVDAGFAPITTDDAYATALFGIYVARLRGHEFGVDLVNDNTGEMWHDPAVVQAAQAVEEMASRGFFHRNIESNIWPIGQQDIALGDVTMYLNGTWLINEVRETAGPDFRWGAFNFPEVPGGINGLETGVFGSMSMAINSASAHPAEAFELIVHMTTGIWDETHAREAIAIPISYGAEWPPEMAGIQTMFDQLRYFMLWAGGVDTNVDMSTILRDNVMRLMGGSITADQFIESMSTAARGM